MKADEIVNFRDNKGNLGNAIIKRIRSASNLDLNVKRRGGKFQLYLDVPKETSSNKKKKLSVWWPFVSKDEKKESGFKKSEQDSKKEKKTFSSQHNG